MGVCGVGSRMKFASETWEAQQKERGPDCSLHAAHSTGGGGTSSCGAVRNSNNIRENVVGIKENWVSCRQMGAGLWETVSDVVSDSNAQASTNTRGNT